MPPAHYHKLGEVLRDTEECKIILKWASPVLVWMSACVYRWLNAQTMKDAQP